MVSMDLPTAVKSYQFGERAKSELIVVSQLCSALTGFPDTQKGGGKKMLLLLMEQVRSEVLFAAKGTGEREFERAADSLNEAISLVESDQPEQAAEKTRRGYQCVYHPGAGSMAGPLGSWTPLIFWDFSRARSSVREYDETPLSEDETEYILSCAGTAPSAGNLEAWDVVVVTDR